MKDDVVAATIHARLPVCVCVSMHMLLMGDILRFGSSHSA